MEEDRLFREHLLMTARNNIGRVESVLQYTVPVLYLVPTRSVQYCLFSPRIGRN
jgi:hypothetical protein